MISVFQENNEVLQQLWADCSQGQNEYLQQDKLIEWIKSALEKTNVLENFEQSLTDLDGLLKQYSVEVLGANEEQLENIAFNYSEAVQFLKWLTSTEQHENQNNNEEFRPKTQEAQNQPQPEEPNQQYDPVEDNSGFQSLKKSGVDQNLQLSRGSPNIKSGNSHPESKEMPVRQHPKKQRGSPKLKTEGEKQQYQPFENATVAGQEFSLQTLAKKYKDYLRVIFEHYCKASYATGQDPTFEQIKHKTTVMTINKFMLFCKDFELQKISKSLNRNFLVQLFKKHSECYKQMSFQQFDEVLKKIACVGFAQGQQQVKGQGQLSGEMVKLLQFCELSNPKKFKEKMKKLNIQYRLGTKTNAELKVPEGYRFKFTSNNGKSEEQVKQEIEERRQHRSERKILLQDKVSSHPEANAFRKRTMSKRTERYDYQKGKQLAAIKESNSQSTNIINKVLNPPIPPPKRIMARPPLPPHPVHTPQTTHTPSTSNQGGTSHNTNSTNIFKKQLGYAQIHKIKQSQGYSKKRQGGNKSISREEKSNFRLNSIVEQARMQVQEMPQKQAASDLTDSIATNSREQTNRSRNYDVGKINSKMQIINQRNRRDLRIQEQLNGILDISNDQDQFLKQHLEREKKNEFLSKRISVKIQNLDKQI